MSEVPQSPQRAQQTKKLRSACDACHQCKVKCPGGTPCSRCLSKGLSCRYGFQNRAGKPKGSKNKKTLERQRQMNDAWMAQLSPGNGDETPSILEPEQPNFSPSCSTILDDAELEWYQDPTAFYAGSSSTPYTTPDQFAFNDVIYGGLGHNFDPSNFSDPWPMEPDLCHTNSSDETLAECNEYVSRLRLGSADGAKVEETDPSLAMGVGMEIPSPDHLTSMPTSCNCMQKQAANVASLDQIKSGNAAGLDRFDTVIQSVTIAIDGCIHFVNCSLCEKSLSSMILTLSVINLVLLVLKQSTGYRTATGQSHIPCFIGSYKTSTEEQDTIQRTLLEMSLRKGRQALKAVSGLVATSAEQADPSMERSLDAESAVKRGLCRLSASDKDYILSYIARMEMSTSDVMSYSMAAPPLATP